MKRFLFIAIFLISLGTTAQNSFKDFYKSHKEEAALSINVPSFFANWFIDKDDTTDEFNTFLKRSKNYKILIFNNTSVQKDFKKFTRKNKLKSLVRIKDGKDRVMVYYNESDDYIREIIMNVTSDEGQLVLVGLKTKLTKEEFAQLISSDNFSIASN